MDVLYKQRTTYSTNFEDNWYLIDARDKILGRVASLIAYRLQGKHLETYTPSVYQPDGFVIVNAKHIKVSGKKYTDKIYKWHTGYIGHVRERNFATQIKLNPEKVFISAIKGMLPRNKLSRRLLKRVRIFQDDSHNMNSLQLKELKIEV